MLVSAPFDNWWHDAYGLDVQILSPPHTLLALGMTGVAVGAMILVASERNRSAAENQPLANGLFLFTCGTLVTMCMIFVMEFSFPNHQHGARFYRVVCMLLPLYPVIGARATGLKWAATGVAAIYMLMVLVMVWLLPLFPGQPMLAPILNHVTHMVPPPWPILAVVPAIGVDLVLRFFGKTPAFWRDTGIALLVGVVFFLLLLAAQWYFAQFLLTPASHNAFFVGDRVWSYGAGAGKWQSDYWNFPGDKFRWETAWIPILFAAIECRLGLWFGNWLGAVKR